MVSMSLLSASAVVFSLCPPMPDDPNSWLTNESTIRVQMEEGWAVTPASSVGDEGGPAAAGGDPADIGRWGEPFPLPRAAIHSMLLPTGKVLQYYRIPNEGNATRAWVFDPDSTEFEYVDWDPEIFCSGHSLLADGRVYVTGGTAPGCTGTEGLRVTNLFDPFTESWTALDEMVEGRYYPTNLTLPDGRVLIFAGVNEQCTQNRKVEMYTPGVGVELLPVPEKTLRSYPRLHLLSSGKIAHVGEGGLTMEFDLETGWRNVVISNHGFRKQGTSILLPGRTDQVMIIGGGDPPPVTPTCEIIDFTDPEPEWRYTTPMFHARAHADALILPDKTVMLMGGGQNGKYEDPILIPELFDPETETWIELAEYVYPRMYHATTTLLPDGRVLASGQDYGESDVWGEIYEPPYLFRGERPVIESAPAQATYGGAFTIDTASADGIESVVLVRLTSVTHSVNMEQRLVDLEFENLGDGRLRAVGPVGPTHAPVGYYMLFLVDGDGVPSESVMIRLLPGVFADIDGDGVVDFTDMLMVLAAWGDCPAQEECPEDLDGNDVVDLDDLLLVLANWTPL